MSDMKCPLGDDCDLTIAWMMGAERAKDTIKAQAAEIERLRADHKAACDLAERHMNEKHKLLAAISWIEPPFVDDNTSESELRSRIKFCIADAKRAALEGK